MSERYNDQKAGEESQEFLENLRNGEEDAWAWFFHTYNPIILGYFLSRIRRLNKYDSEILIKNVFEKLIRSQKILGTKRTLMNYVFLLAHNEYVNFVVPIIRRLKRGELDESPEISLEDYPDKDSQFVYEEDMMEAVEQSDAFKAIMQVLKDNLNDDEFTLLVRHFINHESHADIAKSIGQKVGSVENKVVRMRKKLKKLMAESEDLRDLLDGFF